MRGVTVNVDKLKVECELDLDILKDLKSNCPDMISLYSGNRTYTEVIAFLKEEKRRCAYFNINTIRQMMYDLEELSEKDDFSIKANVAMFYRIVGHDIVGHIFKTDKVIAFHFYTDDKFILNRLEKNEKCGNQPENFKGTNLKCGLSLNHSGEHQWSYEYFDDEMRIVYYWK